MRVRAAIFLPMLVAALPAFAHGEQLVVTCVVVFFIVPAVLVLLIPWHSLRLRLITAAIVGVAAWIAWRMAWSMRAPAAQWSIILTPTMLALLLAVALRLALPREP